MICSYCGRENTPGSANCAACGSPLSQPAPVQYQPQYNMPYSAPRIPDEYKPLSPWAYFGYQLLFSIPLVGFILLIIFSCGGSSNINLKNYARSYWCALLVGFIISIVFVVFALVFGVAMEDVLYELM